MNWVEDLWTHRSLISQLVQREVLSRYRGSALGLAWALLTPLAMLAIYTGVFVGVFNAHWIGKESAGGLEFAMQVFAGLLAFNIFAEVVGRAPRLVLEQPNLVTKVVFPLQVLPCVAVLTALTQATPGLFLWLIGVSWIQGGLEVNMLAAPIGLLALGGICLGLGWWLAALGVFLRDIGHIMGLMMSGLMFLSPVFYARSALPPSWQTAMAFNPLTLPIEWLRWTALEAQAPSALACGCYVLAAACLTVSGYVVFQRTRIGFSDVL